VVTVSGADIPNGTVVISGGKITAVGANAAVPAGAKIIDATGLMVYPGMIETGSSVVSRPTGGIISGQAALINLAGDTPPKMAVEPRVALVMQLPRSGFGGRGFARAAALQQGQNVDANRVRQAQLDSLRDLLRDAAAYEKAQAAYAKDKSLPRPAHDVVLASLIPALDGTMPVVFPADRATDIRDAVNFAEEMHLKPIIM